MLKDRVQQSAIDYARKKGHIELAQKMADAEYVSLKDIVDAGVIEKHYYERYSHVFDNQMRRQLNLPHHVIDKLKYLFFYRTGKLGRSSEGIVPAVKKDLATLRSALREGYVVNDSSVHDFINTPLECAAERSDLSMVNLLIRYGSILTDNAYSQAKTKEIKDRLVDAKIAQLDILKKELNLQDKDPSQCRLG